MSLSDNKRDYYDVLGISRSADKSTIKRAYRKLAKKYHPDTNAGNAQAEEKFKEATEAYNVLSDPEKKKLYDQFGHAAFEQGGVRAVNFSGSCQNRRLRDCCESPRWCPARARRHSHSAPACCGCAFCCRTTMRLHGGA